MSNGDYQTARVWEFGDNTDDILICPLCPSVRSGKNMKAHILSAHSFSDQAKALVAAAEIEHGLLKWAEGPIIGREMAGERTTALVVARIREMINQKMIELGYNEASIDEALATVKVEPQPGSPVNLVVSYRVPPDVEGVLMQIEPTPRPESSGPVLHWPPTDEEIEAAERKFHLECPDYPPTAEDAGPRGCLIGLCWIGVFYIVLGLIVWGLIKFL